MKTLKEIKNSPFKQPIKKYYLGEINYGTPYFFPYNFNPTIISVRKLILKTEEEIEEYKKRYPHLKYKEGDKFKNIPMPRQCKNWTFKIFGSWFYIALGYPLSIKSNDLGWKDKWDTPRFEWSPAFYIFFFKWQFCIWWNSPDGDSDGYYEQVLWYLRYCDKDIVKAEETWGWADGTTKLSTWNKNYLK